MVNKKISPYVSIIICTYNGENRIKECIESLLNQTYLKENYEIIVVNDASTDDTSKVVSKFPVKLINNKKNLGRYKSVNIGLSQTKGEIIADIGDDCIADRNWLKNIVLPYKDEKVVAVGGPIKSFYSDSLAEKYLGEMGYGNPPHKEFMKSKNVFFRFFIYLKEKMSILNKEEKGIFEVTEIYANASFRKSLFDKIGNWDSSLKFRGDTEIFNRIHNQLVKKKILFNTNAIITHKHKINSFTKLLKDNFLRNKDTLKIYQKDNKFPPIFPFPLITIFLSILFALFNVLLLPFSLLLLPQILYFWWPVKFFIKLKPYYLILPYMQLLMEMSTILGIIRGYIIIKREHNKKLKQKKR